jgi:two-component system, NtrC family, response regulator HydG
MPRSALTSADREYFAQLSDVVFGNPYSVRRAELIGRLAQGVPAEDLVRDPGALARVVDARLVPLLARARDAGLSAEEGRLLEPGLLYACYHRHLQKFDVLIERQVDKSGESLEVQFADEVLADLAHSGFPQERASRYLALFFQLRRAYYFINRSLAGDCESMRRLREALWNNLFTHDMRGFEAALWNRMEDFSTLILGETGTGKGAVAAAIGRSGYIPYVAERHRFAANFTETFIAINLSQFPETLIESELFGHQKGAFTGAISHHEGVFERCDAHGALFLDEIGEVTIPVQIKLLQVLQERTFTPVGGREKKRFGGRVIAATNQPLGALRREGRFRHDFFYRLCSDVVAVPTLRQRIAESAGELEQLVRLLVLRIAGVAAPELVAAVLQALEVGLPRGYSWPGNVRELEQAVRRILLTGRYAGDVLETSTSEDDRLVSDLRAGSLTAGELLDRYCALLYRRFGTYAEVARHAGLDPRTTRKRVDDAMPRKQVKRSDVAT